MAEFVFNHGAMNSGKSTALINAAYNYREHDFPVLVTKPETDTKGDSAVVARDGLSLEIDFWTNRDDDIRKKVHEIGQLACKPHVLFVDEAQFLQPEQVDQLFELSKVDNVGVIAYGLRADAFRQMFAASKRLFELADTLKELTTICRCGSEAKHNTRRKNGVYIFEGEQVAIDGEGDITYSSLCGSCYIDEMHKAGAY